MTHPSERIKDAADKYIKQCWPQGCPPRQKIEVKLALYAGMMAMFAEIQVVTAHHGDDDIAAAGELEEVVNAVKQRALKLNEERSK